MTDVLSRFDAQNVLKVTTATGELRSCKIKGSRGQQQGFLIVALEGVTTREAAEALAGKELLAPGDVSPVLPDGRYYWHEIIGMEVCTDDGRCLGVVEEIIETGSNDVYVVQGGGKEVLIPAIASVVGSIDVAGKRMMIHPVPGLLDEM